MLKLIHKYATETLDLNYHENHSYVLSGAGVKPLIHFHCIIQLYMQEVCCGCVGVGVGVGSGVGVK